MPAPLLGGVLLMNRTALEDAIGKRGREAIQRYENAKVDLTKARAELKMFEMKFAANFPAFRAEFESDDALLEYVVKSHSIQVIEMIRRLLGRKDFKP
jgi:hypothetical protein